MNEFERVKGLVSLKEYAEANLERVRGGYVCPNCGSGTGPNKSPAFSIMPNGSRWTCFSCGASGDVFDLAGVINGTEDKREQLQAVASWAGIQLEGRQIVKPAPRPKTEQKAAKEEPDYTEGRRREAAYIESTRAGLNNPEAVAYLSARGFTLEDAQALGFGYDAQKRRLVIPWKGCSWYHIDRDVTGRYEQEPDKHPKYMKPATANVGQQPLYNVDAAKQPAFFIVEGVLDALAVEACGYQAIAIASNKISHSNAEELAGAIAAAGGNTTACLFLDNDGRGREGAALVEAALKAAGVSYVQATIEEQPKDADEWRKTDTEGLKAHLTGVYNAAVNGAAEARERAYMQALEHLKVFNPASIAASIYTLEGAAEAEATGFEQLDEVLDGGVKDGFLYALGAVSSMGKTTFTLQVADYIAARGRSVLFVTIEQSAKEIVSKSIARLVNERNQNGYNLISPTEALSPARREFWNEGKTLALLEACEHYTREIAPKMKILEGTEQPSIEDIEAVAKMIEAHDGRAPVVFIDYLQLLKSPDDRLSDKQATDRNVMALRQLARDMKAPVWVISSLNRASYSEGVTMDAFKESGAIEYSCDVLLGLQPQGLRDRLDKKGETTQKREAEKVIRENKSMIERPCELLILKNRNGATPKDGIRLTLKAACARYLEEQ